MGSSMKLALASAALAGLVAVAACQPAPVATNASNTAAPANAATNTAATNALTAGPVTGPDADAAKAFLVGLYAHYRTEKGNTFNMFDTNVREVFDADTIKLLADDTKALKGELGEIDGDWLCNCQDFTSIQATITVTAATPTTAQARADYHDTGDPTRPPDHDQFDLVKTPIGWRIHDITITGEDLSLRATLQKEINDLVHGGSAVSGPSTNSAHAIDDAD